MSDAVRSVAPDRPATGLSRRQIVRAAAWAAPVLVLATAAPATAASTPPNTPTPTQPPKDGLRMYSNWASRQWGTGWGTRGRLIGATQAGNATDATITGVTIIATRSDLPGRSQTLWTGSLGAYKGSDAAPIDWASPTAGDAPITVTYTITAPGYEAVVGSSTV